MRVGQFIKRLRPFSLAVATFAIVQPWTFRLRIAYEMSPALWLLYAGTVILIVGWLTATYLHDARRARDPYEVDVGYLVTCGIVFAIGGLLMAFYNPIYMHARLALQRPAMERYITGGDACPAATACLRDEDGTVFFVWGSHDTVRTGLCHDAAGTLAELRRAREAVLEQNPNGPAQIFGGHVTVAEPLSGDWIDCSISTRFVTN